jgi:hypothetical protein
VKEEAIEEIAVATVGEKYGTFRIVSPLADAAIVKSMQRHWQMSPVVCVKAGSGYELIDDFKRLRACRRLNKPVLKSKTVEFSERACKPAIIQLNKSGRPINEMEEAMILQSLHREDGLTQIEIAALVGRHKELGKPENFADREVKRRGAGRYKAGIVIGKHRPEVGEVVPGQPPGNPESIFPLPGWLVCSGTGGCNKTEQPARMNRNQWPNAPENAQISKFYSHQKGAKINLIRREYQIDYKSFLKQILTIAKLTIST